MAMICFAKPLCPCWQGIHGTTCLVKKRGWRHRYSMATLLWVFWHGILCSTQHWLVVGNLFGFHFWQWATTSCIWFFWTKQIQKSLWQGTSAWCTTFCNQCSCQWDQMVIWMMKMGLWELFQSKIAHPLGHVWTVYQRTTKIVAAGGSPQDKFWIDAMTFNLTGLMQKLHKSFALVDHVCTRLLTKQWPVIGFVLMSHQTQKSVRGHAWKAVWQGSSLACICTKKQCGHASCNGATNLWSMQGSWFTATGLSSGAMCCTSCQLLWCSSVHGRHCWCPTCQWW